MQTRHLGHGLHAVHFILYKYYLYIVLHGPILFDTAKTI